MSSQKLQESHLVSRRGSSSCIARAAEYFPLAVAVNYSSSLFTRIISPCRRRARTLCKTTAAAATSVRLSGREGEGGARQAPIQHPSHDRRPGHAPRQTDRPTPAVLLTRFSRAISPGRWHAFLFGASR